MSESHILVVEDDPHMQRLLNSQLKMRGFEVTVAGTGSAGLASLSESEPNLVLLDITLPDIDGLEVCRRLREWSAVPVILVTAADTPQTKVNALELGADDYLIKPFHMGELVARIRAVLRRVNSKSPASQSVVKVDDISIDLMRREVRRGEEVVRLTKIEFDLLRELVTHGDMVLTYEYLLESVWGLGYHDVRPVHVHICNLRRKLEHGPTNPRYIIALPGIGYRFRLREQTS